MKSRRLWFIGVLALAGAAFGVVSAVGSNSSFGTKNRVLEHALAVEQGAATQDPKRAQLSGGVVVAALDFTGVLEQRAAQAGARGPAKAPGRSQASTQGCQNVYSAGGSTNVRVNQDCSLPAPGRRGDRGRSEQPQAPDRGTERLPYRLQPLRLRLVLRRRQDLGRPGSALLPVRQCRTGTPSTRAATRPRRSTRTGTPMSAAFSSTSTTPPARSSSLKSNAGASAARSTTPRRRGRTRRIRTTRSVLSLNDNDPNVAHDKEFIVADAKASSPKARQRLRDLDPLRFRHRGRRRRTQPDLLQPVNRRRRDLVAGNRDQRRRTRRSAPTSAASPIRTPATRIRARIRSSERTGRSTSHSATATLRTWASTSTCSSSARRRPTARTRRAGPRRPRSTTTSACSPRARCGDRLSGRPPVPAAERLSARRLHPGLDRRRQQRHAVLGLGRLPERYGRTVIRTARAGATPPCNNDVFYAYSTDGGAHWSVTKTSRRRPNSGRAHSGCRGAL